MRYKIVEIKEDTMLNEVDLKKGDKIKVLESSIDIEDGFINNYNKCNDAVTGMDFETDDPTIKRFLNDIDKALLGIEKYLDRNNLWDIIG